MAGKYAHLVDRLPKEMPGGGDPKAQDLVNLMKDELVKAGDTKPTSLARRYVDLKRAKALKEQELATLDIELTALEQLMDKLFDDEQITKIELVDGASVSVSPEVTCSIVDHKAFRKWCVENGLESELKLNAQTAASLIKTRLLEAADEDDPAALLRAVPPGVKVGSRAKFSVRVK